MAAPISNIEMELGNTHRFTAIFFACILCWCVIPACAQGKKGTLKKDTVQMSLLKTRVAREIMESIQVGSGKRDSLFRKSEDIFKPYSGKVIRKIYIEQIDFDKFYDGANKVRHFIADVGDKLHANTRREVIRNNLFIREGRLLNAYKVADNERYLRDLEFILDARIEVQPVTGTDSVDLVVITRDVFSVGGEGVPRRADKYEFGIYDANLAGWGQRLAYTGLIDYQRNPQYGQEFLYRKNSVLGSLVNATLGYTSINTGSSYGRENERAFYLKLSRPLVSPYTRLAGGIEISRNLSDNVYGRADSLFLDYTYNVYDLWTGYNIGINNMVQNRNRHFFAVRWFHQDFRKVPKQAFVAADADYHDNSYVLGEFTVFRQDFYKARYIYGFGRTEDVPYGYSASVSVGQARQLGLRRLYVGGELTQKVVDDDGDFYELSAQGATYLRKGELEDITLLLSSSWYSKLLRLKKYKVRQYVKTSYAIELNPVVNDLLKLGNEFGVRGFNTDSLQGEQRLGVTSETLIFTHWKLLGFHFAPLVFVDMALIPPLKRHLFYDKPYLGVGAGMRTRNENLIFGTIEGRFTYYPRITGNVSRFKIDFSFNLRVKYSDTFVRAPSFLQFN